MKPESVRQAAPTGSGFLPVILSLIGFSAIIAQIVLMRELMVVFYGNEISLGLMLASWLLWTAIGSSLVGRLAAHVRNPRAFLAGLEVLLALVFPLTIFAVRLSRSLFHPMPGELLGPVPMLVTSLLVLSVLCILSGSLFPAGSRLLAVESGGSIASASGSVYLLEALGSGVGGLLASLVLIRYVSPFNIAAFVSLLNLLAALLLIVRNPRTRLASGALVTVLFALLVFPFATQRLEVLSLGYLWKGFHLVESRNSLYGNLTIVETEGSRALYENGIVIFTVPDPAAAEEAVHYALLEHPSPRSLLLVGGGVNGSLAQALQHPTLEHVDYVELDPVILDLARQYFSRVWLPIQADRRVAVHPMDGRRFLKTTHLTYDVIIINLPDPQTAQLNRFYTREFFREAARRLNPGGVLAFQVTGAENYISDDLAAFLRCLDQTLRAAFPDVAVFPGATIHFFASKQAGLLTTDARILVARLKARRLATQYVREYYLPFTLSPDRLADLEAQIQPQARTPLNLDFAPRAYYFDVALWSSRFSSGYRRVFEALARFGFAPMLGAVAIGLAILLGFFYAWPRLGAAIARLQGRPPDGFFAPPGVADHRRRRVAAGFCVAAMGFTLMGLEILLLLGFQSLYGYVYHQLSLLIALFMVGMALGAHASRRHARLSHAEGGQGLPPLLGPPALRRPEELSAALPVEIRRLALLQVVAALAPAALYLLFEAFARVSSPAGIFVGSQVVFPGLALASGLLGGVQFPLASRIYFAGAGDSNVSAGTLYGLDLAGACLGAVALSAWFFPVFGFWRSAVLMAAVNLAPALQAALAAPGRTR